METSEFIDMVMSDASPNDLADSIKQMLYTKSVEKIDGVRPYLGAQMFDPTEQETEEGE
tara:strand:+ start:324 stop:500 length:177 start_codon:yes stop_codon:yes gene_type:complete